MYVSRERKLPKPRGCPRENQDVDVTDWLEDIGARKMSPGEMFDFIMEHLAGEAKSEMRLRFRGERDAMILLDVTEESCGTVDSTTNPKKNSSGGISERLNLLRITL